MWWSVNFELGCTLLCQIEGSEVTLVKWVALYIKSYEKNQTRPIFNQPELTWCQNKVYKHGQIRPIHVKKFNIFLYKTFKQNLPFVYSIRLTLLIKNFTYNSKKVNNHRLWEKLSSPNSRSKMTYTTSIEIYK